MLLGVSVTLSQLREAHGALNQGVLVLGSEQGHLDPAPLGWGPFAAVLCPVVAQGCGYTEVTLSPARGDGVPGVLRS